MFNLWLRSIALLHNQASLTREISVKQRSAA